MRRICMWLLFVVFVGMNGGSYGLCGLAVM